MPSGNGFATVPHCCSVGSLQAKGKRLLQEQGIHLPPRRCSKACRRGQPCRALWAVPHVEKFYASREQKLMAEEIELDIRNAEQAQRLRATAEAGAARFGAASAKPNQGRPPDAIARLRRQRVKPMLGNGDSSSGDAAAYKTDESAERESHSERLVRDYRLWGRQGGQIEPCAQRPAWESSAPGKGTAGTHQCWNIWKQSWHRR
ncbi:hypothetical protein WJX75_005489 [Coccomyxa subellipsoidea]|uniref:Post-SET domain-containing protein n=1 Tax=Coccomyxa subellipsoidea TaxID=248742 RepID=A0ABR2YMN3_9CHLO